MSTESAFCGICGRPMVDHGADAHDPAKGPGKRVEYVVVGLPGGPGGEAEYRELEGEAKVRKTEADVLAINLRVEASTLLGRRFSCLVTPAEYGVVRSDFRLIEE
jgi:hypothetical protein